MELAKNQEHTVTIEGYGEGGMGVARIDGRVVFVHGALRGEKCRVLILKTLKSVAFAKVLEVLEPSSERIESDCPYFPRCGGCTYRHIRYEEELRLKRQRVQDNLSRIGGSDVTVEEILGAQDTLRYRNKAQYPVSKDGAVGFYRARTHEVIECEHCLLVKPEAAAAAEALREYMQSCRVAGYDEKTGRGLVRHLYVRSNAAGESLVCVLVNGDKLPKEDRLVTLLRDACPKCTGIVLGTNTKKGNVILGDRYRTLWGSDRLEDTLCGKTFRLSVPSFYQVNRIQAERLYAKAIEFAGLTGQETVLDLYCGAGTITLLAASRGARATGVEIVPPAVFAARVMELLGYETEPVSSAVRHDIIQMIHMKEPEALKKFCKGIQFGAPVDSYVTPEPWDMPGYDCQVIMAAGAFIQGASIELSADAPMREPYTVYLQGGLTFESGKLGVLLAVEGLLNH